MNSNTQELAGGKVSRSITDAVGTVTFSHPKGNSLPGPVLREIAASIEALGSDPSVKVIVLRSEGEKAFCGGASFDELLEVNSLEKGQAFFSGFALVILAIKRCPKFVIGRIQAKAVGGGVGVAAACDYALAHESASIRLSELALGIGPFTIGPAVQRKIGISAFSETSICADWRDAAWAKEKGLYVELYADIASLDAAVEATAKRLSAFSPEATRALKKVLWEGTDNWEEVLKQRVATTSGLVLSDFSQNAIQAAKNASK